MFLGVKAIEYTHKWDLGLLLQEIAGPLLVTALCYFVGVFIGIGFENAEAGGKEHHPPAAARHHDADGEHGHDQEHDGEHEASESSAREANKGAADDAEQPPAGRDGDSAGASPDDRAATRLVAVRSAEAEPASDPIEPGAIPIEAIDQPGGAGLFFSIYYCMTGVHAIHILGGMAVLAWLLVRATKDQFHEQYFGPVDYVGLYWHLVDLIWIYLFPLLYLIK
jgi:cytochrome c oxidase subunit III